MFWKNETDEYGVQESLRLYADYPGSVSALFFSPCAKRRRDFKGYQSNHKIMNAQENLT